MGHLHLLRLVYERLNITEYQDKNKFLETITFAENFKNCHKSGSKKIV